jgi:hypothetical protein
LEKFKKKSPVYSTTTFFEKILFIFGPKIDSKIDRVDEIDISRAPKIFAP